MNSAAERSAVDDEVRDVEPYNRVFPSLLAIPSGDLLRVNFEIPMGVRTVFAALPGILKHRSEMLGLPGWDVACVDRLEDFALAARYAHTQYLTAEGTSDDLQKLHAEAQVTRDDLRFELLPIIRRGVISPDCIKPYKGTRGYRNVVHDLKLLVAIFEGLLPTMNGQCLTKRGELELADKLATRIERSLGQRAHAPKVIAGYADLRARAFTLFVNAYSEVRAALTYLRRKHGDADKIAPKIWAGAGHSRARSTPARHATKPNLNSVAPLPPPEPGTDPFLQ